MGKSEKNFGCLCNILWLLYVTALVLIVLAGALEWLD